MSSNEQVLAVRASVAKSILRIEQGFVPIGQYSDLNQFFSPADIVIGARDWLEHDENWMQLIPYAVVQKGMDVLSYTRTKKGGEAKLHDKVSCGFGGHINMFDITSQYFEKDECIDIESAVYAAAERELEEELSDGLDDPTIRGFIIDTTNPVGRVHLGVLMTVTSHGDDGSLDKGIKLNGYKTVEEMLEDADTEAWSKIALRAIQSNFEFEFST
jgi:predicted NUDIX family phosphoesterase